MFLKTCRASNLIALMLFLGSVSAVEAQETPEGKADPKTPALRRGASISGWVKADSGVVLDSARCRVVLKSRSRVDPEDAREVELVSRMNREVKVDAHGFFQVLDAIPGEYEVHAEQDGAVSDSDRNVQVAKGAATHLSAPLLLEPSLDLEIAVKPAKDWHGRPWVVHVERSGLRPETSVGAFTSEEGIARFPHQIRGRFIVEIEDAVGEGGLTERDLFFDPSPARREFQISWVEVRGRIRLGDRPLRAALGFSNRFSSASGRLNSDDEGRFSGTLIRDGHWRIQVKALSPSPPLSSMEVHRTIEARNGRAEIEIEIPNTRLFGQVVDAAGHPVAKAMVSALDRDGANPWVFADASGRFEIHGVAPGPVTLGSEARLGGFFSEERLLTLPRGGELGPIELALRAPLRFAGRVLSARGPELNARVTVLGVGPIRYDYVETRTAKDGSFEAEVPTAVEGAVAVVGALGSPLTAFKVQAGRKADLSIPKIGGTVEINLGPSLGRRVADEDLSLLLLQNGLELPQPKLADWAGLHGEPTPRGTVRRFSELAPAEYSACLVPLSAQLDLVRRGWAPKLAIECRSGSLAPQGTLRLAFDKDEPVKKATP